MRSPVSTGSSAVCRLRDACPTCLSSRSGLQPPFPARPICCLHLSVRSASLALPTTRPTTPSADFCPAVRMPCGTLSRRSDTEQISWVSSAAFRAPSPGLRFASLMDMDFAVSGPLVRRSRLVPGFCPSTRAFARCFLQTPPRGDSPCTLLALHLHQVERRTFTSKLLSMPSTPLNRYARCNVFIGPWSEVLAVKPANKAEHSAAEQSTAELFDTELVEPREETKRNAGRQSTCGTQGQISVSQALERIRRVAKERKKEKFTSLLHHISIDLFDEAFFELKEEAAPGVDGLTWAEYEQNLDRNIEDLHARVHRGAYRALPSRRVYIPKPDGRQRPLAVAMWAA